MKVIILLFAMCFGSGLALKDALSGLNYQQEVIYLDHTTQPAPSLAADSVSHDEKEHV
jgi:hypothetical protein